ncbi:MAG: hypothetical protein HQL52_07790 [Magnetococcales bacterium]|nr:hypothetical protein [Magnetococcales bacterium]
MATICPQCQYQRQPADTGPAYECPQCGVIYKKAQASKDKREKEAWRKTASKGPPAGSKIRGPGSRDSSPWVTKMLIWGLMGGALATGFWDQITGTYLKNSLAEWQTFNSSELNRRLTVELPCSPEPEKNHDNSQFMEALEKFPPIQHCEVLDFKTGLAYMKMKPDWTIDLNRWVENVIKLYIQQHMGGVTDRKINLEEITFQNYPAFEGNVDFKVWGRSHRLEAMAIQDKQELWMVLVGIMDDPNRREMSQRLFESVDISRKK